MDIDRGLLSAVLREGMGKFYDEAITPEMMEGVGKVGFTFIDGYFRSYGQVPSGETLMRETGVSLAGLPIEPLAFWCAEVRKRFLYNSMRIGLGESLDKLERRDVDGAMTDLEKMVFDLRRQAPGQQRTQSLFSNPDELFEAYEQAGAGVTGIPLPWDSGNLITMGWQPEDLVIVAARMGLGKTWLLCVLAKWAWDQGYKVLLGSTEMSRLALRRRIAALATKTSYGRLRRGNLTSMEYEVFQQKMRALADDKRFLIMGDGFSVTLESVDAAIVEYKPDLVCLDGIYLLRSSRASNRNKFERVSDILDLTKDMAKRNKVPIIATAQLNREQKKFGGKQGPSEITMDRLAFSDNIGMVADYVFFIKQTKEMREAKELAIQPGKVRESEAIKDIIINWDFELQDFTEKKESEAEAKKKRAAEKQQDAASRAAGDDTFKDDDLTNIMNEPLRDTVW